MLIPGPGAASFVRAAALTRLRLVVGAEGVAHFESGRSAVLIVRAHLRLPRWLLFSWACEIASDSAGVLLFVLLAAGFRPFEEALRGMQVPRLHWDNDLLGRQHSAPSSPGSNPALQFIGTAAPLCRVFPASGPAAYASRRPSGFLLVAHSLCLPAGSLPRTKRLPALAHSLQTCVHCYWRQIMPGGGYLVGESLCLSLFFRRQLVYVSVCMN